MPDIKPYHRWFNDARFGMFVHWGPYAVIGRGEQSLFRDHLDQAEYEQAACRWNPQDYDARAWAQVARDAGMRYAVLTTRHHDGYCLWDSKLTDYTAAAQAPQRDFVREYVEAFRAAGLRVGLYYSLADWRVPAYWEGPAHDPAGFEAFIEYVHGQVEELLTNYGNIDVIWFDGAWPHDADRWRAVELTKKMRAWQPEILINNRLSLVDGTDPAALEAPGGSQSLGDFSTPEHHITADRNRIWESCQVSTWRLWGHTIGEQWRSSAQLLDMLVEAAGKGGNLLLNVGPDEHGRLPEPFVDRAEAIGRWMRLHGEAIYGTDAGDATEFVTYGRQIRKGNDLYLVIRFWDRRGEVRVAGLESKVKAATLLATGEALPYEQTEDVLIVRGMSRQKPTELFPVIKLCFDEPPRARSWAVDRLWSGDARRMTAWAKKRGSSVYVGR